MNSFCLFVVTLLLSQSLGEEVDNLPRKHNMISPIVNKLLDPIFKNLSSQPILIPKVDLAEVGNFSNLTIRISGGLTKEVDGYKAMGFQLKADARKIIITGSYHILNLNITGLFPIFGKGDLYVALEQITQNLVLSAIFYEADQKFDIKVPKFSIAAGNATVKFDNLMDDPNITAFLNELIGNLVPDLFTTLNEPLLPIVRFLADEFGNGIMLCIKNDTFNAKECIEKFIKEKLEVVAVVLSSRIAEIVRSLGGKSLL